MKISPQAMKGTAYQTGSPKLVQLVRFAKMEAESARNAAELANDPTYPIDLAVKGADQAAQAASQYAAELDGVAMGTKDSAACHYAAARAHRHAAQAANAATSGKRGGRDA